MLKSESSKLAELENIDASNIICIYLTELHRNE